jgi:transposase
LAAPARTIDHAGIAALRARVRERRLVEPDDYLVIDDLLGLASDLTVALAHKRASLVRLRRLVFGPSSDRRVAPASVPAKPDIEPSTPTPTDVAPSPSPSPASESPRGHGRRPASAYPGARRVDCTNALRPGDRCPECFGRGRLYDTNTPSVVIKMTGRPFVEATQFSREVLRCSACLARFHAPLPDGVTPERWDATADVALAVTKYCAGLPWYRSERLQAFFGVAIPASTQFDRCEHVADCLLPIFRELEQLAAMAGTFVLDDTTVRILDLMRENKTLPEGERRGTWTTGIIARGATHHVALYYSGRRHAGDNFERLLEKRPAAMKPPIGLGDAASRNWPASFQLTVAKCLAHARREFVDLETAFPGECAHVLDDLARIYRYDAETNGMPPEDRLAHHQLHSGPVFDRLRGFIEQEIAEHRVEPNGPLFKSYRYLLTHWHGLTQVLRLGSAPIDANIVERALKKVVLLRKNAMFFRSQHGADVGSMILSVSETSRMAGVAVFDYLVDVVRHARAVRADPRRWLPWTWAARERAPDCAAA